MGLFSKLFGNSEQQAPPRAQQQQYAPGTEIPYDGQLISRFKGHHQSLLKLFNNISLAVKEHDYEQIMQALKKFVNVLEQHVLEENLKLYVYLQKCIHDDDHNEMISDMKLEMAQISREVRSFVRHHLQFGVNAVNIEKFGHDLNGIGAALVDRIQREEDALYPLYMPPRNYEAL